MKDDIEPAALDFKQACRYLNISERKLNDLCSEGHIRPARLGAKRLFLRSQLDDLLRRAIQKRVG